MRLGMVPALARTLPDFDEIVDNTQITSANG